MRGWLAAAVLPALLAGLLAPELSTAQEPLCPKRCICIKRAVRCIYMKLNTVPLVPKDTAVLDLRFNNIHHVPAGAFSNLNYLTTLLLSNNHLTVLDPNTFKGLKKLKLLYLYKNKIHYLDDNAFSGLENLQQLYLNDNKIASFNREVFSTLPSLQRLFMHNNEIRHIPSGAFDDMPKLQRLRLDSNFLVCDCSLIGLFKLVSKHRTNRTAFQAAANCDTPTEMAGMSLTSLTEKDLHCELPSILKEPEDVEITFGGTVIFTCEVKGDPEPEIIWMHDSQKITINEHYEVLDNGSLKITNPDESDGGYFECMAVNPVGEAISKPAKMTLRTQRHIEELKFTTVPNNYWIKEGAPILVLDCQAVGNPKPHIFWYHEDEKILLSDKIKMKSNGSLIIYDVAADDTGKYTCEASNIDSSIYADADIEIFSKPKLAEHPTLTVVQIGSDVSFQCSVEAFPIPVTTWYKNGEALVASDKILFDDEGNELIIKNAEATDAGTYLCRSANSEGFIENIAKLQVSSIEEKQPKIVYEPVDVETLPGNFIELPCKAEGIPKPIMEWKKDGNIVGRTLRHKITSIGSLHILNVTALDNGRYECTATNIYGRASKSAFVRVKLPKSDLTSDDLIRNALSQAAADVDEAINKTIAHLFNSNKRHVDFGELFRASRFPNEPAREIARAAEIYERTLVNIRRNVNMGMKLNATEAFHYEEILTPKQLDLIAKLSGCMVHRKIRNCSDVCFHKKYRSIDGSCNNYKNPMYGASLTGFRRIMQPIYENGFSQPVGWTKDIRYNGYSLPSARLISSKIISTKEITPDTEISHMVMQWGQFLDHDLDHATPSVSSQSWDGIDCKKSCEYAAPCFPMDVPPGDLRISNRRCIDFIRSSSICGSGMTSVIFGKVQPREQINQLTSFIDASQVYGFSEELSKDLRNLRSDDGTLRKGVVFPGNKPLLPYAGNQGVDCRRDPLESTVNCFVAGDIRANEQVGLLAMHTLWFREHNRLANELRLINPHWDGEKLFHEARKIVGAQMQHITYSQWLPIILGPSGMRILGSYQRYNDTINPSISNVFATAALRFGHSLINPILHRLDHDFQPIPQGHLQLHKAFFSPWRLVDEGGIDPLLRGLFSVPAKLKTATQNLNMELTEKLFHNAHAVALDLAAMNIQRSRDHAIPPYVEWRKFCGMSEVNSFVDLINEIPDKSVLEKLQELYGSPRNIDVWVGGILENQLPGAKVGPLFQCLLIEQFKRLRDGDRLWYENPTTFKSNQLYEIRKANLARVLCDNGDNITRVSGDVFKLPSTQGGVGSCDGLPSIDLKLWADCSDCESTNSESNVIRLRRSLQESESEKKLQDIQEQLRYMENKIGELSSQLKAYEIKLSQMEKRI